MKLPFNFILAPVLKPYLGKTRMFCYSPAFALSIHYTCLYGILGFFTSANHLRNHLGEAPPELFHGPSGLCKMGNFMMIHDLKIITTAMGLVQYMCLFVGCITGNPALFLPHLLGQIIVIAAKVLQVLLLITTLNIKAKKRLLQNIPAIFLLTFNWCQEFCVFRQYLCICDL